MQILLEQMSDEQKFVVTEKLVHEVCHWLKATSLMNDKC